MDAARVTQDDLYRAWRKAVEAVSGGEQGDPQALTTREICQYVLGNPPTLWFLKQTREQLRVWKAAGMIEVTRKPVEDIGGTMKPAPAFRLVNGKVDEGELTGL